VPYQAFEAEDPEAVKQAVAEVDRQQNLPLDYAERIPRRDFSAWFFALALLAGAIALVSRLLTRPAWTQESAIMKLRQAGTLARHPARVMSLLFSAYEAYRLSQARDFNRLLTSAVDAAATQDTPEAEFARALSLAARNDYEGAVRAYKALSRSTEGDLLEAVLYNLGNLHLREALKYGPEEIGRSLPLAELAKTSYRELLQR
jgi:mxaK protein